MLVGRGMVLKNTIIQNPRLITVYYTHTGRCDAIKIFSVRIPKALGKAQILPHFGCKW